MKNPDDTATSKRSATPTVRWLKSKLNSLEPSDTKQVFRVADRTGLRIEITPNRTDAKGSHIPGRKALRYVVRFNDKPLYITLRHFEKDGAGEFLRWTTQMLWGENVSDVDQVDESLDVIKDQLRKGINPNETLNDRRESGTLGDLFSEYCARFESYIRNGEKRQKSLDDSRSIWKNHVKEHLADRRVLDISEDDARAYLDELLGRTSGAIHNKALKLLRAVYNYAIEHSKVKGLIINPFARVKILSDVRRQRRLSKVELVQLRDALHAEKQVYQDIVMMLLLTGQRKGNVLSMEWREINAEEGIWTIPQSKFKSKKPHAVPLSAQAMEILNRRSAEAIPGQRFVFPSANSASGHIIEKSGTGSFWRRIIVRAGLYSQDGAETLRMHDLRRSIASFSIERGASIQSVSRLLGHSDISITSNIYAHMDLKQVRGELVQTTDMLLSEPGTKKLEILRDQIIALSSDDRLKLMAMIQEVEG